jgi:hypothetical protein
MKNPCLVPVLMDDKTYSANDLSCGIATFLLLGLYFCINGVIFWPNGWGWMVGGIGCFVGMFAFLGWMLRRIRMKRKEIVYQRGSRQGDDDPVI